MLNFEGFSLVNPWQLGINQQLLWDSGSSFLKILSKVLAIQVETLNILEDLMQTKALGLFDL